jgi:hypothetical protein
MVSAFQRLQGIPRKKIGIGAAICMAKEHLPLTENAWIVPVNMI